MISRDVCRHSPLDFLPPFLKVIFSLILIAIFVRFTFFYFPLAYETAKDMGNAIEHPAEKTPAQKCEELGGTPLFTENYRPAPLQLPRVTYDFSGCSLKPTTATI